MDTGKHANGSAAVRGHDAHDSDKDDDAGTARTAPFISTIDGRRPPPAGPDLPAQGFSRH